MRRLAIVQAGPTSPPAIAVYLKCSIRPCPSVFLLGENRPVRALYGDAAAAGWHLGDRRGDERCPDHRPDAPWALPAATLDPTRTLTDGDDLTREQLLALAAAEEADRLEGEDRAVVAGWVLEGLRAIDGPEAA